MTSGSQMKGECRALILRLALCLNPLMSLEKDGGCWRF